MNGRRPGLAARLYRTLGGRFLVQLKDILWVLFVSMLPVVELRGAIPIGAALGLPDWLNYMLCVAGNMLPVPVIILFAKRVLAWCAKLPKVGGFFQKIIDRANRKANKIGDYELLGVLLFVAIPLPGTGAWTGALVAAVLQLRMKKAFFAILLGVLISGVIVLLITNGVEFLIT